MSSASAEVKSQNPSSDNIRNTEHKIRIIYRLESGGGGGTISEDWHEKATSIFKQEKTDRGKAINQLRSHGEDVVSGVAAGLLIEKCIPFSNIEKVEFEGKGHVVYEISFPHEHHDDFVKLVSTEDFTSKLRSAGTEADKHVQEKVGSTGVHEDIVGILKKFSIILVDPFTCKTKIPPMNCNYNMDSSKRGKLVIFNHVEFSVDLKPRIGSDKDNKSLVDTFEQLGFEVTSYRNQKKEEVKKKITEISNQDYSEFNCFACVIMTHGGENGALWASDDKFDLKTVVNLFRSRTSLIGKPKLFFIQACRGDKGDPGVQKDADATPTNFTIPIEADFLISYASTEGYVSYRSPEEGTWYIQTLTECLQQHKNLEITHILTLVSRKVCMEMTVPAKEHQKEKHQAPCFVSRLTGFLYFSGKNNYPNSEVTEPASRKRSLALDEMEELYLKNNCEQNRLKTQIDDIKLERHRRKKRPLEGSSSDSS